MKHLHLPSDDYLEKTNYYQELHKNKRNIVFIIISKLKCDFVSKIIKISYLFATHVHHGKELKMLLTDEPNCRFDLLH